MPLRLLNFIKGSWTTEMQEDDSEEDFSVNIEDDWDDMLDQVDVEDPNIMQFKK